MQMLRHDFVMQGTKLKRVMLYQQRYFYSVNVPYLLHTDKPLLALW